MKVYLVYDNANELQEITLSEPGAETRAGHFGGGYECRTVEPLPAYNSGELQRVIDDLDAMRAYVAPHEEGAEPGTSFVRALQVASNILTMFPEEALRAQHEYSVPAPSPL